jgi:hypothetical protein
MSEQPTYGLTQIAEATVIKAADIKEENDDSRNGDSVS